jgi:HAD superfamily hydrolase (TIGR01549 family)
VFLAPGENPGTCTSRFRRSYVSPDFPKAILFDMGGVLQDASERWTPEVWLRACPAHLIRPEPFDWFMAMSQECVETFLALPVPRPPLDLRPIIARWLEKRGETASPERVETWFRSLQWWEAQPVYPFVRPALAELQAMGLRMGIISNTVMPGNVLCEHFAASGILEFFEFTVFSGGFGTNKPDPAIFKHALDAMRLAAEEAWYVGDKPQRDVCGAHSVGMRSVLVDSAHTERIHDAPENVPEYRIANMGALPGLLRGI